MASQVTLKDVAARTGVSISTVSRVLRGDLSRPVEARTVERIRSVARELNYQPNLAARSLARQEIVLLSHRREIGVILGLKSYKFSDPFFSRVIEGIDAEILANGRRLRFVYSLAELDEGGLRGEMVRPDVVAGVIGVSLDTAALHRLISTGVAPIVVIEGMVHTNTIDRVSCDKEGAVRQLLDHLWSLGHRRFGYLGPLEEERCRHFRSWLALAGVHDPAVIDTDGAWDMEAGYASLQTLLKRPRDQWPSAVMAACDTLAVGALRALSEKSVRVPEDLALVGFDDTMGGFTSPSLTTVSVQREQLGRLAVRRLIARQRHPDEPPVRMIAATELIIRESSRRADPERRGDTGSVSFG